MLLGKFCGFEVTEDTDLRLACFVWENIKLSPNVSSLPKENVITANVSSNNTFIKTSIYTHMFYIICCLLYEDTHNWSLYIRAQMEKINGGRRMACTNV